MKLKNQVSNIMEIFVCHFVFALGYYLITNDKYSAIELSLLLIQTWTQLLFYFRKDDCH